MGGAAKGAGTGMVLGGPAGGASWGATADIAGLGKNSPGGFLGTLGNMAGAGTGAGGTGFAAPSMGNIQQATSVKDVNAAEKAVSNNAQAQKNLLAALQGQNGLGLQTGVMNQQQALANALQQANGVGTQNAAIQGLQNTAGMYGNIAAGVGPNPAQAMLNQQTGTNVANQAALMAGQRGAGANAGLMARQAAQQGGALQQNAVGQGATMQANQQLNALQGLAATQSAFGNMGGQQVGQLQGQQGAMANQANQMAGQQIAQTNQNMNAALSNQQMQQNALAGVNNSNVGMQSNVNSANAGMANTRMGQQGQMIGGIMQGAGAAFGMAEGGEVRLAMGGAPDYASMATQNPQSDFTALANAAPGAPNVSNPAFDAQSNTDLNKGAAALSEGMGNSIKSSPDQSQTMMAANKGTLSQSAPSAVPTMVAAEGGLAEKGGRVKAKSDSQKAVASGDDYANDKIPAKLSEGEIVLPRTVTMSENPEQAAAQFVKETLAKKNGGVNLAEGGEPKAAMLDPNQKPEAVLVDAPVQDMPQGASPKPQAPIATPGVTEPQQPQAGQVPTQPAMDPDEEDLVKYNTDLASGAITPKTYSDLFGKKDTLGKIGTIFGLLVSGAGAGLTGQPNALLKMMDNEIERDLRAQKETKDSARNFVSLEAENRLKKSQTQAQNIANVGKTIEGIGKAAEVGAGLDFILKSSPEARKLVDNYNKQTSDIMDEGNARARLKLTAAHKIMLDAQKTGNPQAINAAQQVQQAAGQQASQDIKNAKAKVSIIQAKKNDEIKKVYSMIAPVNDEKYNSAIYSKLLDPNVGGGEKTAIEQNRKDYYQFMDTFDKLESMKNAGQAPAGKQALTTGLGFLDKWTGGAGKSDAKELAQNAFERDRNVLVEGLTSALEGRMSKEEIESLLPSTFDSRNSLEMARKKVYEKFKNAKAENAINLKRFKLVNEFPKFVDKSKKENANLDAEMKGQAEQAKKKGKK